MPSSNPINIIKAEVVFEETIRNFTVKVSKLGDLDYRYHIYEKLAVQGTQNKLHTQLTLFDTLEAARAAAMKHLGRLK